MSSDDGKLLSSSRGDTALECGSLTGHWAEYAARGRNAPGRGVLGNRSARLTSITVTAPRSRASARGRARGVVVAFQWSLRLRRRARLNSRARRPRGFPCSATGVECLMRVVSLLTLVAA